MHLKRFKLHRDRLFLSQILTVDNHVDYIDSFSSKRDRVLSTDVIVRSYLSRWPRWFSGRGVPHQAPSVRNFLISNIAWALICFD